MIFLSVLLLWFACLLTYLSSPKQQLIDKPLAKLMAWGAFFSLFITAFWGFSHFYSYLVGSLIILVLVMTMWTLLVFAAAHFAKRIFLVNALAISLFSLITAVTFIGAGHVA